MTTSSPPEVADAPPTGDLKRKLVRGGIVVGVLVALVICLIAAVPGLDGVRAAIIGASPGWIVAACVLQLVGVAGAVVFVQTVFDELPRRLSWWQGWGMQGANAVLPAAGSTGVSYWAVSSVGWATYRFVERTAVMVVAPGAPNLLLMLVLGVGMGLGLVDGPNDWWLTWLPAAIAAVVIVLALLGAVWADRIARRTKQVRVSQALEVLSTGVTGTVVVLRRRSWRVLGTWVDLAGSIGVLWACLIAVGDHLPFAIVAMSYLVGQAAQVIPIPGGIGATDLAVTGTLLIYGAPIVVTSAGVLIAHAIALLIPVAFGALAFLFLPREIARERRSTALYADPVAG